MGKTRGGREFNSGSLGQRRLVVTDGWVAPKQSEDLVAFIEGSQPALGREWVDRRGTEIRRLMGHDELVMRSFVLATTSPSSITPLNGLLEARCRHRMVRREV